MKSVFKRISSPISSLSAAPNNADASAEPRLAALQMSSSGLHGGSNLTSSPSITSESLVTDDHDDGADSSDISDIELVERYAGPPQDPDSADLETSRKTLSRRLLRRDISFTDANSIIGGSSVNYTNSPSPDNEDVIVNGTNNGQLPLHVAKNRTTTSSTKTAKTHMELIEPLLGKAHKIFSFQLPFGGSLTFPRRVKIPFITSSSALPNSSELDEELRLKLERNETITTLEEAKIFAHFKGVDNGRLRAVKKLLTPSIATELRRAYSTGSSRPDYETVYDELEGDVVILGGYRGSILRDAKTHKRVWIPIKAGFKLRKIDLYIGPSEQDELDQPKKIYPDGMLSHIGPVDISKKLIKRLKMNPNLRVHEFGYDWRLSGHYNSDKLEQLLVKIRESNPKGAYVIAHSMGGLIAHHVMNKNPDLVRGLCYVGVPSECPNVLGPVRFGDDVLLSDKILTLEINFMMRSSFLFLPLSGELFVDRKTHSKVILDYFDVNTWINYNLSPLVGLNRLKFETDVKEGKIKSLEMYDRHGGTVNTYNNLSSPVIVENLTNFRTSYEDSVKYLDRTLKKTKKFLQELEFRPDVKYPPLVAIYGNTIPSLRGSFISGEEDIKQGNWFDFFYGPGDGVVNQHWIMPERRGFQVDAKFDSSCGHVALMTDLDNVGKLLRALVDAEKGR